VTYREFAGIRHGFPAVPNLYLILRCRRLLVLTVVGMSMASVEVAQASGGQATNSSGTAEAAVASTQAVMADRSLPRDARRPKATANATIRVRPFDVGALAPSAFGDWDHPAADQTRQ
jgi:hypothetical protein